MHCKSFFSVWVNEYLSHEKDFLFFSFSLEWRGSDIFSCPTLINDASFLCRVKWLHFSEWRPHKREPQTPGVGGRKELGLAAVCDDDKHCGQEKKSLDVVKHAKSRETPNLCCWKFCFLFPNLLIAAMKNKYPLTLPHLYLFLPLDYVGFYQFTLSHCVTQRKIEQAPQGSVWSKFLSFSLLDPLESHYG